MNLLLLCRAEPLSRWQQPLTQRLPHDRLIVEATHSAPGSIDVVIADSPPQGIWKQFPNLKLIQSLWMGVDRWLHDPSLPAHVPIARMIDPNMVTAMTETVVAHVLHVHLHHDDMRRQQSERRWEEFYNPVAAKRSVGILGLGSLGAAAARALTDLGFRVSGWSRRPKSLDAVRCYAGAEQLGDFLAVSEILVCLLPLTRATRGIANAGFFRQMPSGAVFINVGRGAHVVEADLLHALDSGHLRHAILDVFEQEPLPREHRFWTHSRVTVSPHSASMANPESASDFVAENLRRLRVGEPLLGIVDRAEEY
jgi:glyoxylate/hydroxypyruvate reductase A